MLIDQSFYKVVQQILNGRDVCVCDETCPAGNLEAISRYMRKNMPPQTWHILPATDAGGWNTWLLHAKDLPTSVKTTLHKTAQLGHHFDAEVKAWGIDPDVYVRVKQAVKREYNHTTWCARCLRGDPCDVWDIDLLLSEGFEPRGKRTPRWVSRSTKEAAVTLGVPWPSDRKTIQLAFKKLALKFHPDHGGTDSDMKVLIEARERLWCVCGA